MASPASRPLEVEAHLKTLRKNGQGLTRRLCWRGLVVALLLASAGGIAAAADSPAQDEAAAATVGVPWTGEPGITETVSDIMERERWAPATTAGARETKPRHVLTGPRRQNPSAPAVPQWPVPETSSSLPEPLLPQTVGTSFLGAVVSESGFIPPDSMGAVGPTQVLVIVNGRIKVFDKAGVLGALNASTDTFFNSVRNGSGTSDPHVRYDRLSGRWFLTMINVSTPNRVMIAVSSGSTITNAASFTFFQFQHDLVTPTGDTGDFADYDTLGVDANALYVGVNVFNAAGTAFLGTSGFVIRKSDLLTGILTVTAFRGLTTCNPFCTTGPYTPQGVDNDDPASTEGYFIGVDAAAFSQLDIRRITNPGGTPTISGNLTLVVPTTTFPILQPALGSTHPLDSLDDRLFAAAMHKNKTTGTSTLWTAHNIEVNSSGVGTSGGGRNGSRWYEITNLTTTPALNQSGTLFDSAGSNPLSFWIPSVAMSGQGHMALGSSRAGTLNRAEIAVAGRLATDALGNTQAPTLAQSSSTAYNVQGVTPQRWGDYSQVVVDPNDDMTMWTFQEYCNATDSWGLRAIQLIAPPPATPASAAPSSMAQGATGDVIITGTVVSGSGFFDPGTGFPNRISAAVNGGGVTVNSVTFTDPTHVTLNLTVAGGATAGSRTVTVTNPDGQAMTSGGGILTITACSPPSAPVAGNNGPICAGETLELTASTVGGATYAWTGPNGFTSALQNPSIPNATAAASGTYSVTVTVAGCTSLAGTTNATVNVCAPAAAGTLVPDGRAVTETLPAGGHAHRATLLAGRSYSVEVDVPFDGATTVGTGGPLPGLTVFRADGTTPLTTAPVSRTTCGPATANRLTFMTSAADIAGGPVQIEVVDSFADGYPYRIRLEETTLFCTRWSINGYNAFVNLQNTSDCPVNATLILYRSDGSMASTTPVALNAVGATQIPISSGMAGGVVFGSAAVFHDGPQGGITGGIYMAQPGVGAGANFRWSFVPVRACGASDGD